MQKIYPDKLVKNDEIRIIAPAISIGIISSELKEIANKRFKDLGFKLSFGKHINECDEFNSSSIISRVEDLNEAFADKNVKAILTVLGGFNSNQLLKYVDWNLIKQNPKIFCGYSDITTLNNSIFSKTGLVTYSGPHYSSFGQKLYFEYTLDYFKKCLFKNDPFEIISSNQWSDDKWFKEQDNRQLIANEGYWVINQGQAEGTILGANLCTLNLLQGTEFMPDLTNAILFIEDDYESHPEIFDRDLQSLIHQPNFNKVKGIVIGRFQKESKMSKNLLEQIIKTKTELDNLPVIANIDFGHTDPKITFPIGGTVTLNVVGKEAELTIIEH